MQQPPGKELEHPQNLLGPEWSEVCSYYTVACPGSLFLGTFGSVLPLATNWGS